ncbi:GNAT family N-acetyltransferase [Bradyrhizobium sp. HKCCYLS2058]|uniref:GNAT family N-acetyltransferase n=1 Tax=Bradyrhizobium TaxID=374 RepID=UPI003EB78899
MHHPVIRPARPDEYDAIARLWMESWCSTGLERPSDTLLSLLKERVPREMEGGWSLYVADDGGQLAAMLAINVPLLYLDQLMIAPSHQGRSLGRRLLAFTRELLPDEVWLRCAEGNEKAWRWYEREGFVLEKEQADPLHGRIMKYYRWKRGDRAADS